MVKSISFSISGSHIFYHIGVAKFLQHNYDLTDVTFLGSSGGALVALCLAIKYPLSILEDKLIHILQKYNAHNTGIYFNCINNDIENLLDSILTDEIAINLDNLIIVNSIIKHKTDWKTIIFSNSLESCIIVKNKIQKFSSKKELIANAIASCHIPLLIDKKLFYKIDQTKYLDGLLTEFQPVLDDETIKVYPYMFDNIWKYLWIFTALWFYSDPKYVIKLISDGYNQSMLNLHHWKNLHKE